MKHFYLKYVFLLVVITLIFACNQPKYLLREYQISDKTKLELNAMVVEAQRDTLSFSTLPTEVLIDSGNGHIDTLSYPKQILAKFYYHVDKKNRVITYNKIGNSNDSDNHIRFFAKGDSIEVTDVPFYYKPFKRYYEHLRKEQAKEPMGRIFSKYVGIDTIKVNESIIEVEKVIFTFNNFWFSELKPDTVLFERKTLIPIALKYNYLDAYELSKLDSLNLINSSSRIILPDEKIKKNPKNHSVQK